MGIAGKQLINFDINEDQLGETFRDFNKFSAFIARNQDKLQDVDADGRTLLHHINLDESYGWEYYSQTELNETSSWLSRQLKVVLNKIAHYSYVDARKQFELLYAQKNLNYFARDNQGKFAADYVNKNILSIDPSIYSIVKFDFKSSLDKAHNDERYDVDYVLKQVMTPILKALDSSAENYAEHQLLGDNLLHILSANKHLFSVVLNKEVMHNRLPVTADYSNFPKEYKYTLEVRFLAPEHKSYGDKQTAKLQNEIESKIKENVVKALLAKIDPTDTNAEHKQPLDLAMQYEPTVTETLSEHYLKDKNLYINKPILEGLFKRAGVNLEGINLLQKQGYSFCSHHPKLEGNSLLQMILPPPEFKKIIKPGGNNQKVVPFPNLEAIKKWGNSVPEGIKKVLDIIKSCDKASLEQPNMHGVSALDQLEYLKAHYTGRPIVQEKYRDLYESIKKDTIESIEVARSKGHEESKLPKTLAALDRADKAHAEGGHGFKTPAHKGLESMKLTLEKKISDFDDRLAKLNKNIEISTEEFRAKFEADKPNAEECLIDCRNPTSSDFTQDWVFV